MNKTYITEIEKEDGLYEGPQIIAEDWFCAARQAEKMGVRLVGVLAEDE